MKTTGIIIKIAAILAMLTVVGCAGGGSPSSPNLNSDVSQSLHIMRFVPQAGVDIEDGPLTVSISPEALDNPASIQVELLSGPDIVGGVRFTPHGLQFKTPVMVTFPLAQSQEPGSLVNISYRDSESESWKAATTTAGSPVYGMVSDDGMRCLMFIDHFSDYALLVKLVNESNEDLNKDTTKLASKPYGDGTIIIPRDFLWAEDGVQSPWLQVFGINDATALSDGPCPGFSVPPILPAPGLDKGLGNSAYRQEIYEDVLKDLFLQPDFPQQSVDIEKLQKMVSLLRSYFFFSLSAEVVPLEPDPPKVTQYLEGVNSNLAMNAVDITYGAFTGLVAIKKIHYSLAIARFTKFAGHLKNFGTIYRTAGVLSSVLAVTSFLQDVGDGLLIIERTNLDTLLLCTMNYQLARERVEAFEYLLNLSDDGALKAAFAKMKDVFLNDNFNTITSLFQETLDKYKQEGLIIAIRTLVDFMQVGALGMEVLIASGVCAAIPGGQIIAGILFAAGLIITGVEFYYENLPKAFRTILRCTAAATIRNTYMAQTEWSENQLLAMDYNQRKPCVHLMMMKVYLAYYYYKGMADVYLQWKWTKPIMNCFHIEEDFWTARHDYLAFNATYYTSMYTDLLNLLADVPPSLPPYWDDTEGITAAEPGHGCIVVNYGTASDPEGEYPLSYNVYYIDQTATGSADPFNGTGKQVVMNAGESSYTIQGLQVDHTYYCGVRVSDSVGNEDLNTNALSAVVLDDYAFNLVDVTPPWLNFSPFDCCVASNYAYVAARFNGLHIFNISDPANPMWVNRVDTPGEARGVAVSNGYAYVADLSGGLQIIDVEPPSSASIVSSVVMPLAQRVEVSNGYAYVVDYNTLEIVDAELPSSAYIVKSVRTPAYAPGVAISNGYAYVADFDSGLQIIDVDPPSSAYIVSSVDIPEYAWDVAVSNSYAYVASTYGVLQIVDVESPSSASIVKTVITGSAYHVAVLDDYAYVAAGESGLQIIDVESPSSAYIVSSVDLPTQARGLAVSNGYAYVADFDHGLQIIDVEPQSSASIVSTMDGVADAHGVAVSNGYAYVADNACGLKIINVEPPESAYVVKSVGMPYGANNVAVSNGYAYVAHNEIGLQIVDVDPPSLASIVKTVYNNGSAWYVAVSNDYAYVTDEDYFRIIDVEPPSSAYTVMSMYTNGAAWGVAVSNSYAYVALSTSGFQIIDVEPPESAYIVKTVDTPDSAKDVSVSNGYAYVADGASGLQIIDVEPPESACIVKTVDTPDSAKDVSVSNGYAYVADGAGGLQIIDVELPESASIVCSVDISLAQCVRISNGYAYVLDGQGCLRIFQLW